jgi:hypothetical protein
MSSSTVAGPIVLAPVTHSVTQTAQTNGSSLRSGIRQLNTDIQAGNLTAAQQDYATLSQSGPLANKNSTNPMVQDLQAVGTALQSGDLQGAQTAFSTFQSAAQSQVGQTAGAGTVHNSHHEGGRHHIGGGDSNTQQTDPLGSAFTLLEQALQSNNLAGAQSAFATIQADLQASGFSFGSASSSGSSSASASAAAAGSLNVSA